jgi:methionine synthase II (cobalamin-independent)
MQSAALIPGNFVINGKLDSETGPVAGAQITISFEGNKITATSGINGTFTANFRKNWGVGLFGTQLLDFKVIPQEPWLTTTTASYKIIIVYLVNCCIFFFILGLLSIVLPRSLKFKTRENRQSQLSPETLLTADKLPQASQIEVNKRIMADNERAIKEYDDGIFYWYRIVLQLVQKISGVLIKPNQTLREYVTATGKATGPAARYLVEFTRMIEKAL